MTFMWQPECFDYNGAAKIIERKALLSEINGVVTEVYPQLGTPAVRIITGLLARKGWDLEVNLLKDTDYKHDAFKQGILIEIDLHGSLLDSVHRNFLRAQELYNRKCIEAMIQIVECNREPKFSKMKRDINVFKSVLSVAIYLIGLHGD